VTVTRRLIFQLLCLIATTQVGALGQGAVTGAANAAGAPSAPTPSPPPALSGPNAWVVWGSAFTGAGVRDNVLLSHTGEERSGFVRGGLDATAWNRKHDRVDYWASVRAFGTRYFSAKTVNHEEQAILLSELNSRAGEAFKFSLAASASYSHLIYDVSDTDLVQVVSEIKRSGGGLGPTMRWMFLPAAWLEASGVARRETYPDGYNNRSIQEGGLRAGWKPSARFEASVAGSEGHRAYDRREQYSAGGRQLAGTVLATTERDLELRVKATLDAAAQWKTVTRAGVTQFVDNGAGFLDYRERKVGQEIDWEAGDWLLEFEATARRLEFQLQTVGVGVAPPPRVRDAFYARVLVERKLGAAWTVYAEYTWERNRCNDPLASYSLNEGLLGIRWNWEK
jgi:hypothetical protein